MNFKYFLYFLPILLNQQPTNGFMLLPDKIKLNFLRKNIDYIDDKIYTLLDLRYKIVKEVGKEKRVVYDRERENRILNRLKEKNKLDDDFVEKLWRLLFLHSYKVQFKDNK